MTQESAPQSLAESLSALLDHQASELELMRLLKASESDPEVKALWARYQLTSAALKGEDLNFMAAPGFAARVAQAVAAEETYSANTSPEQQGTNHQADEANKPHRRVHWFANLGRVAIAASVAGALVIGVQQYQQDVGQTASFADAGVNQAINPQSLPSQPNWQENKPANLPSGINAPALSARTVAVQSGYESRPQENRRVIFVPRQMADSQAGVAGARPLSQSEEEISSYVNQLIEEHSSNAAQNSGQGVLPFTRVVITEEE